MTHAYAISLSSVPPRFGRLGPVVQALLAQSPAPMAVFLCLAERYDRFPGPMQRPDIPDGVTIMPGEDIGPGLKALGAARKAEELGVRLIYCDDDWLAGPGWAQALLSMSDAEHAVTGQGYGIARLGRVSAAQEGMVDIAQGFAGVSVEPRWMTGAEPHTNTASRMVDDIWLSAHLSSQGIAIRECPEARRELRPAFEDAYGLQDAKPGGVTRNAANRRCAALMQERHGIWPLAVKA